jgi:hypothetical protein
MQARAALKLVVPVFAFGFLICQSAGGQAAAEAAGATSVSGAVAGSIKAPPFPKFPTTPAGSSGASESSSASSPHLIASVGPAPQDANRKALEAKAGKDAGKVLLRATPVEAQIWVDGKIVGKTPLLLVLAPGKYQVEMRGARGQTGRQTLDLLPKETREIAVKLDSLYPARVKVQQ